MTTFPTQCEFEVSIAEADVHTFANLVGDLNPLHLDPQHAATTDLGGVVAHGALLAGLVSRVVGMYIPGERALLLALRLQFPKPVLYPARVRVTARLASFDEQRGVGSVRVAIADIARGWTVLTGSADFTLYGRRHAHDSEPKPDAAAVPADGSRTHRLLVTGGTGGLGREVVAELARAYACLCTTRRTDLPAPPDGVEYAPLDLDDAARVDEFLAGHSPSEFFGIVHMSSPPPERAFVSDDRDGLRRQLWHSVELAARLARWARQPGSSVRRMILVGSTAGSRSPQRHLGAYSLGKAAMEHLPTLLAADLAAQGATVNLVAPTLVPVGINAALSERSRKVLEGKMPTGRLLEPNDVAKTIGFLLSDAAGQINGTCVFLDGGSLE